MYDISKCQWASVGHTSKYDCRTYFDDIKSALLHLDWYRSLVWIYCIMYQTYCIRYSRPVNHNTAALTI